MIAPQRASGLRRVVVVAPTTTLKASPFAERQAIFLAAVPLPLDPGPFRGDADSRSPSAKALMLGGAAFAGLAAALAVSALPGPGVVVDLHALAAGESGVGGAAHALLRIAGHFSFAGAVMLGILIAGGESSASAAAGAIFGAALGLVAGACCALLVGLGVLVAPAGVWMVAFGGGFLWPGGLVPLGVALQAGRIRFLGTGPSGPHGPSGVSLLLAAAGIGLILGAIANLGGLIH